MYITVFYYEIYRLIALSWCVLHKIKNKHVGKTGQ